VRLLVLVCVAALALWVTLAYIGQNLAESGFQQDVTFVPSLVNNPRGVTANAIAEAVKARAAERGIQSLDDFHVDVSEPRIGTLNLVGGVMTVKGPGPMSLQDVTISASYTRRFMGLFKRHVDVRVKTTAPGAGPASTYPLPLLAPAPVQQP
jgi:hypothetical protein